MNLQVLAATTGSIAPKCLEASPNRDSTTYLITDQADGEHPVKEPGKDRVFWHRSTSRGLSRNRNTGLSLATADIVLITDNDVHLLPGFDDTIIRSFEQYPDADIIAFSARFSDDKEPMKKYPKTARRLKRADLLHVSSIEIAMKLRSVREKGLMFDERFGLGSTFPTAEENIFLFDANQACCQIWFVPQMIAEHPRLHSGVNFTDPLFFYAKGAAFRRLFGQFGLILGYGFVIKKWGSSGRSFPLASGFLQLTKGFNALRSARRSSR